MSQAMPGFFIWLAEKRPRVPIHETYSVKVSNQLTRFGIDVGSR